MTSEMWIALISLAGSLIGTFAGIVTANKLTQYRIDQLEKRMDNMEKIDERLDTIEKKQVQQETTILVNTEAIKELKNRVA